METLANTFEHTTAALIAYDETKAEREARWQNVQTNADVDAAETADMEAQQKVRTAFYEDTRDYNPLGYVNLLGINDIRVFAGLQPEVGSLNIGRVGFGQLIGEQKPNGQPKFKLASIIGDERVKLLTDVYNGRPLPEGLILVGQLRSGLHTPITIEAVAWQTSSIRKN